MINQAKGKIENLPFIKYFTLSIIKTIQLQKFEYEEKQIINSDLIPQLSEKTIQKSFEIEKNKPQVIIPQSTQRKIMPSIPLPQRKIFQPIRMQPRPISMQIPLSNQMQQLPPQNFAGEIKGDYGRINPLLHDSSISMIECSGPGKELTITRMGQKQFTKIILSPEDIKKTLEQIANEARIPLLEGVFKASVESFSVNAVISDVIGSRFIIRKNTPYSLLEQH